MALFTNIEGAPIVTIKAHNRDKQLLGQMQRPVPRNLAEAVAMFGSKKRLVQFALASLDIAIQQKLRSGSNGSHEVADTWIDD